MPASRKQLQRPHGCAQSTRTLGYSARLVEVAHSLALTAQTEGACRPGHV